MHSDLEWGSGGLSSKGEEAGGSRAHGHPPRPCGNTVAGPRGGDVGGGGCCLPGGEWAGVGRAERTARGPAGRFWGGDIALRSAWTGRWEGDLDGRAWVGRGPGRGQGPLGPGVQSGRLGLGAAPQGGVWARGSAGVTSTGDSGKHTPGEVTGEGRGARQSTEVQAWERSMPGRGGAAGPRGDSPPRRLSGTPGTPAAPGSPAGEAQGRDRLPAARPHRPCSAGEEPAPVPAIRAKSRRHRGPSSSVPLIPRPPGAPHLSLGARSVACLPTPPSAHPPAAIGTS